MHDNRHPTGRALIKVGFLSCGSESILIAAPEGDCGPVDLPRAEA
jgi:hypothetical protein